MQIKGNKTIILDLSLVVIIVVLLFLIARTVQDYNIKPYENANHQLLIKDFTEEQYLHRIEDCIKLIYAPGYGVTKEDIEKVLQLYMTPNCVVRILNENTTSNVNPADVKCMVKEIDYAYGEHQFDSIPRVIADIRVVTKQRYWEFTLEMKLNQDKMIYDIEVF